MQLTQKLFKTLTDNNGGTMIEICTLPVQNYSCETLARFMQLPTLIKRKVQSLGLRQKLIALVSTFGVQHAKNEASVPPTWCANEHFLVAAN